MRRGETFNFVLTEADGRRRFGYCRRFVIEQKGELQPECFCILSFTYVILPLYHVSHAPRPCRPCASFFAQILDIVEDIRKTGASSQVFSFLKSVLAKSMRGCAHKFTHKHTSTAFPKPGDTLSVRTFDGGSYELRRSDNEFMLDMVRAEAGRPSHYNVCGVCRSPSTFC